MASKTRSNNDDDIDLQPGTALAWFRKKLVSREEISMPEFSKEFGYVHEQDAHAALSHALSSSEIPQLARTKFTTEYETWRRNEGAEYWASRITDHKIEVSTKKTAGNLVDRSELLAERLLRKPPQDEPEAATGSVSDTLTFKNRDPATSMPSVSKAHNIQKEQDDLDDDIDKFAALEELELIAEWTSAQSSPFYEVARYIYDQVDGKSASLPSVPTDISTNPKQMFEKALDLLCKSGDLPSQDLDSVYQSMMYGSIPGDHPAYDLVNALYPDGDAAFAMSMPNLQNFVYTKLAEDTTKWRRTKDDQEQYIVLKLMSQILLWLEHSHFERPVSEHVYVSAWSSIFNTLLASDGLRVIPGELGSQASKRFRQLTEQEFWDQVEHRYHQNGPQGGSNTTRHGEVAIFESKPVVSDATCERQHNKSIRLSTAILHNLESHGLDICRWYPIIAETRAASADFYTIKKYEDVFGRHLLHYASEATAVLSTNPPSPFPVMPPSPRIPIMQYKESTFAPLAFDPSYVSSAESPPSTLPPSNVKRTKPFVMFSPCKSKKTRVEDSVDDVDDQDDDVE
ncbi:hypothetical protein BGZ65_007638 [Modicella reniformis]|uniref:Uncharacterized protein n=1 Tax=Modicella reniformis TaxID=1440133 RepID=A0A9P6IIS5_9FUNG|nr:hypothetical protein BGZ65_007638 [Modicella reniformis]